MLESDTIEPLAIDNEPHASFFLVAFVVVFFATAFIATDFYWDVSTYDDYALPADEVESQIESGSSIRKLCFVGVGMFGLLLCVLPSRQKLQAITLPSLLLLSYVVLCYASVAWTDIGWLTIKRLITSTFSLFAIFGVAKHLSLRDLLNTAIAIGSIFIGISLLAEFSHGTFNPLSSSYRFAGIIHPNGQSGVCGIVAIAAFFGMRDAERGKVLYMVLFMFAISLVMLTKSRAAIAGVVAGIFCTWYLFASREKQAVVGLSLPAVIGAGMIVLLLFGVELTSSATTAAELGRGASGDIGSLNGRVPLWEHLIERVLERPILGYGYQGFWTPQRVYEVSLEQGWTIPSAHSLVLEVLLGTGFVGGLLFALGLVVVFVQTARICLQSERADTLFVFAALIFSMFGGIFESGFADPGGFETFITGAAVFHLLSRRNPLGEEEDENDEPEWAHAPVWDRAAVGGTA